MSKRANIRPFARKWFDERFENPSGKMYASKFFKEDESWTKCKAWWFRLNMDDVNEMVNKNECCYLLCQKEEDANSFHCLKVPAAFIQRNGNLIKKAIFGASGAYFFNLMLSACSGNMFQDVYPKNGIDLSQFKFTATRA